VPSRAKSSNLKTAREPIFSSAHIVTVSNNPKENPHYMDITFSSDDPERRTAILILQLAHVDSGRYRSCGFALGQHSAFASFALFDRHNLTVHTATTVSCLMVTRLRMFWVPDLTAICIFPQHIWPPICQQRVGSRTKREWRRVQQEQLSREVTLLVATTSCNRISVSGLLVIPRSAGPTCITLGWEKQDVSFSSA
jgi:hypothetical protein